MDILLCFGSLAKDNLPRHLGKHAQQEEQLRLAAAFHIRMKAT